mmetsp:Transcript_3095/g.9444  ORF Transcript_3095/g.9444 Transcript_3095/m.9444 type:complete len:124 (-) Transcript_3095:228-599(-)
MSSLSSESGSPSGDVLKLGDLHEVVSEDDLPQDPWGELCDVVAPVGKGRKKKTTTWRRRLHLDRGVKDFRRGMRQSLDRTVTMAHAARVSLQKDAYIEFSDGGAPFFPRQGVWSKVAKIFGRR